jgi:hypothetical protein
MKKRKNPAFLYGATPREAIHKLVDKAIAAGAEGARDAESFLDTAVTAKALTEGAVSGLDFYVKREESAAKGGKESAAVRQARIAERDKAIRDAYASMRDTEKHNRAAKLAARFKLSPSQVRRILRKRA